MTNPQLQMVKEGPVLNFKFIWEKLLILQAADASGGLIGPPAAPTCLNPRSKSSIFQTQDTENRWLC